ncbi:DUF892 family protein [Salmonella enterica]|nr:DUF892 family protein [Salmonella enterica]
MNIKTVEDLFIHLLSDTYSAEKQLTKALPKLARATSNEKLSQAFQSHLEETQGQIERIEECKMNYTEHYHDWLRDAHAMEKQAESMLESMASRIENYPDIKARIEQHISETKHQITMLEEVLDRNGISRSVLKDSMSKMAAMGQSIGGMFPSDEIVKGSISGYVFEQFEIACYTSLLAAAKKAGDTASIPTIEAILKEEMQMADWLIKHIPQTTEQFLLRSEADGVEAKK